MKERKYRMIEIDTIYNTDCIKGMRQMPDGVVDLVVADPPYAFKGVRGGGAFGSKSEDGTKG